MRQILIAVLMCVLVATAGCAPAASEAASVEVEERTLNIAVNIVDEIDVFIDLTNAERSGEALSTN